MYLDVTYFGYGVGLVMAGWFFGMVVGTVFRALRSVWFFSLFFLLFVPFSLQAAQFDCYTLSTAFITHENTNNDKVKVEGESTVIVGSLVQSFPCKGILKVNCPNNDFSVSILTIDRYAPKRIQEYMILVSIFIGSIAAIAFVIAVDNLSDSRGSV